LALGSGFAAGLFFNRGSKNQVGKARSIRSILRQLINCSRGILNLPRG
jgi:hypothetical protein